MIRFKVINQNDSADIAQCYSLHKASQPFPWSYDLFVDMVTQPYSLTMAMNSNAHFLGYVLTLRVLDETTIMDIAVTPVARQHGVGTALLEYAIQRASSHRGSRVLLEVRATNQRAINLYYKCGFEQVAVRKDYYPSAKNAIEPNVNTTEVSLREDASIMQYIIN